MYYYSCYCFSFCSFRGFSYGKGDHPIHIRMSVQTNLGSEMYLIPLRESCNLFGAYHPLESHRPT